MNPVAKALWYIESHLARDLSLDEIAAGAEVSRFHLTRAFGAATGRSPMRYARGRRLTRAAQTLARGAPDIMAVALDAGYSSHEAFTRSFRDQFNCTPESVRDSRNLNRLSLVDPIRLEETVSPQLPPVRFEHCKTLLVAGISRRYTCETSAGVPAQWNEFLPQFGHVPGQVGRIAYGVRCNTDSEGAFDYVCGVEVPSFAPLSASLTRIRVPAQKYAVFSHTEHVAAIRGTWSTIWNEWLPKSGHEVVDAPDFERYGEEFDSRTGLGGFEIWLPIKG